MIAAERAIMTKLKSAGLALAIAIALPGAAQAEPLKVLTAGAFKQVLLAVIPQFQASGHDIKWENDTVGNITKRIDAGETFDLVIASPAALDTLGKSGKVAGGAVDLAKVGVGVAVREGAAKPDISSVDAFKQALLAAKGVAYIDPASGGTSGIYVAGLIDTLGIGAEIRQKAVLVPGGAAAERVASGEPNWRSIRSARYCRSKAWCWSARCRRQFNDIRCIRAAIATVPKKSHRRRR